MDVVVVVQRYLRTDETGESAHVRQSATCLRRSALRGKTKGETDLSQTSVLPSGRRLVTVESLVKVFGHVRSRGPQEVATVQQSATQVRRSAVRRSSLARCQLSREETVSGERPVVILGRVGSVCVRRLPEGAGVTVEVAPVQQPGAGVRRQAMPGLVHLASGLPRQQHLRYDQRK